MHGVGPYRLAASNNPGYSLPTGLFRSRVEMPCYNDSPKSGSMRGPQAKARYTTHSGLNAEHHLRLQNRFKLGLEERC